MAAPATTRIESLAHREEGWRRCAEGIRAKDAECMARLYDETSPILYGLASRILGDRRRAEDVVVAVYEEVWGSPESIASRQSGVLSALVILIRNRALERLREKGNESSQTEAGGFASDSEGGRWMDRMPVLLALESIAPEEREAIELAFFGGLAEKELAAKLAVPVSTIKKRIKAGIVNLRSALATAARAGTDN